MHACKTPRAPQYIKDATIFLEHEVFSGRLFSWQHADTSASIMRSIFFNNCENNERITSFNDKILNFLNVCGPYVLMRSVNFGAV